MGRLLESVWRLGGAGREGGPVVWQMVRLSKDCKFKIYNPLAGGGFKIAPPFTMLQNCDLPGPVGVYPGGDDFGQNCIIFLKDISKIRFLTVS